MINACVVRNNDITSVFKFLNQLHSLHLVALVDHRFASGVPAIPLTVVLALVPFTATRSVVFIASAFLIAQGFVKTIVSGVVISVIVPVGCITVPVAFASVAVCIKEAWLCKTKEIEL